MQPADSVSYRGLAVAAVALTAAGAVAVAPCDALVPTVPPAISEPIDDHWLLANRLANVIVERQWHEIDDAALAIARSSPYAPWVPAALALAIDELDTIALALARTGNCFELTLFRAQIEREWPRGAGAMRPVHCTVTIARSLTGDARWQPIELLRVHPDAPAP